MRSPAAIRAAAQSGIDLSPVERAVNKFIQTYGPGVIAAVATAIVDTVQHNQQADLETLGKAALVALGTSLALAVRKWWTAHQDAPGSTPAVEPEPAPEPLAESPAVATYADVPADGAEEAVEAPQGGEIVPTTPEEPAAP